MFVSRIFFCCLYMCTNVCPIYVDNIIHYGWPVCFWQIERCFGVLFDFFYSKKWIKATVLRWWLDFGFNAITMYPWFVTSYDFLEQIWNVVNCSCVTSMRRYFCSKFGNFVTIIQNHCLHCFTASLLQCFHLLLTYSGDQDVIDIFLGFLKSVIAHSDCVLHIVNSPNEHFKCLCTFNLSLYTKLNIVSKSTPNLFICQKQTGFVNNTYSMCTTCMFTNLTEIKCENQTYVTHEILK